MPGVRTCALENLMLAKKPEKLRANMKMACRWVLMMMMHRKFIALVICNAPHVQISAAFIEFEDSELMMASTPDLIHCPHVQNSLCGDMSQADSQIINPFYHMPPRTTKHTRSKLKKFQYNIPFSV